MDLSVEDLRRLIVEETASFRAEREAVKRRRNDLLAAKGRAKVVLTVCSKSVCDVVSVVALFVACWTAIVIVSFMVMCARAAR